MPWTALNWSAPWFAPYAQLGQRLAQAAALQGSVAAGFNQIQNELIKAGVSSPQVAGRPLRAVPQSDLPAGEAYEAYIFRTGQLPTRDNLHDFLGGLMWLYHPQIKCRFNALQAQQIAEAGGRQVRGPVRDALTLLDENGLFLEGPPDLIGLLRERRWRDLLHTQRLRWLAEMRVTLLGHALLEKLASPYKSLTAHVWALALPDSLTPERLASKPFLHLPVLGIPGWWPDNTDALFYEDAAVFRPPRAATFSVGTSP